MTHHAATRGHAPHRILVHAMGAAMLAAGLATPARLGAQTLRLGEVYDELRAASPRIAASDALARAARARVSSAGRPPDPQLQLGWMNYELPSLRPMESVGMTQLQLMQMLPLGGKLGLARGVASARADAELARAREVAWETRSRAAMAFFDIHAADRALGVMRETLRLLEDARRTAEAMYRVGEGRQADVLRAQVEIARMIEDTLRMRTMRTTMTERLAALLDRPEGGTIGTVEIPDFPASVPALEELEARAREGRPMLAAAADEVTAAERMARLTRKELLPDLTVGVQYGQRSAAMPSADPMAPAASRVERMGSLMLGVSLPVFARDRQLRARTEAEAMRAMATAELAEMRADTRGRLRETYAALERARRLQTLYRGTILPQADAASASAYSAYRVGQVDFMTLLDSRMTLNRFRQELATLEADEGKAWAELEMLVGGELLPLDTAKAEGGVR